MQRFTKNLGAMLSSDFELHLVTTNSEDLPSNTKDYFRIYGTKYSDTTAGETKALYSYLNNTSPDVVTQITKPPKHGLIVGALGEYFGVPTVYRLSGDRFGAYKVRMQWEEPFYFGYNNLIGRVPLELADYYIALGQHGKQTLTNRGVPEERIATLPPTIDSEKFQSDVPPVELPSVPDERRVVLFVGRLIRLKGIRTLESVIPDLVDRQQDLHFVLVGEPVDRLEIPQKYNNHVSVVGTVPPVEMPQYYSLADVLVHPSLTEGLPLVLIEALLSEVPVVARSVGDIPDITQNTFNNEAELKELLRDIDEIPLDNGDKFALNHMSLQYEKFYSEFD